MDLNIGLFNESFPPVMDGVAICVQNYAYWMQKKVGGVSVITPNVPGADYNQYDYEVLDYFSVPVPFRQPYVTGIAEVDPTFLAKIVKRRFKIVHAHSPFAAGIAATKVAKRLNIPMVATFHSKYRDDFSQTIPSKAVVEQIIKRIVSFYERADEVWVPQASVKDVIKDYGFKGNVEVVPNGSDLVANYPDAYFTDARKQLGIAPNDFVCLFVGQHIWQKNVRLTIEALEKVKDTSFKMFFVGNGYAAEKVLTAKSPLWAPSLSAKLSSSIMQLLTCSCFPRFTTQTVWSSRRQRRCKHPLSWWKLPRQPPSSLITRMVF